jgi:hypothetical protein
MTPLIVAPLPTCVNKDLRRDLFFLLQVVDENPFMQGVEDTFHDRGGAVRFNGKEIRLGTCCSFHRCLHPALL